MIAVLAVGVWDGRDLFGSYLPNTPCFTSFSICCCNSSSRRCSRSRRLTSRCSRCSRSRSRSFCKAAKSSSSLRFCSADFSRGGDTVATVAAAGLAEVWDTGGLDWDTTVTFCTAPELISTSTTIFDSFGLFILISILARLVLLSIGAIVWDVVVVLVWVVVIDGFGLSALFIRAVFLPSTTEADECLVLFPFCTGATAGVVEVVVFLPENWAALFWTLAAEVLDLMTGVALLLLEWRWERWELDCTGSPEESDWRNGESRTEDFTATATRIGDAGRRPWDLSACKEACFSSRAVVLEVKDSLEPGDLPQGADFDGVVGVVNVVCSSSRLDGLLFMPLLLVWRLLLRRRCELAAFGEGDLRFCSLDGEEMELAVLLELSFEGNVRGFSRIADDFVAHS